MNEEKFKIGNSVVFLVKKNIDISKISFYDVKQDILEISGKIGQDK